MNDLTFGGTLIACLAATVITVWMEAATAPADHERAAQTQSHPKPARDANSRDKTCTTTLAAASASAE